jgi:hypothetical protein
MNKKDEQILVNIAKSMHKAICKAFNYKEGKAKGKDVVSDILDPNMIPEADPKQIPPRKTGVMYKGKYTREQVAKKATEALLKKYKSTKKQQSLDKE